MHRVLRLLAGLVVVVLAACSSPSSPDAEPSSTGTPTVTASDPAAIAAGMSDEDLVGQVLMPSVELAASPESVAGTIRDYHLGGVILMGSAQGDDEQVAADVRALTKAVQEAGTRPARLLIGIDQEYGFVTRLRSGIVQLPSGMAIGAAGRPDLTEAAWAAVGTELASLGVNVDFAPDADVIGSAGNTVIGSRSFGSDPAAVSAQVAAAVKGLEKSGVAATVKHFPGHGHTTVDSHEATPVLTQSRETLDREDLPPFRAGIAAGVSLVMAGHLDVRALDPDLPASFSPKVLADLLRGELGFQGVVVTDALNMAPAKRWTAGEAAVRAINAGSDLLLMPADLGAAQRGLLDGLHSGALPKARLVDAVTRLLKLRLRLPAPAPSTVNSQPHQATADAVAAAATTVLKGPCSGPLVTGPVRVTGSGGRETPIGWLTEALRQQGMQVVSTGGQVVHLVGYGDGPADLSPAARVTVAMDSPYVLAKASTPVRVATYSSSRASMEALAAVIAGKAPAPGHSPVPVTGLPRSAC